MLSPSYLDVLPDPILELYERYMQSVINDIARRLSNLDIESASWQMQRLSESGKVYEKALEELSEVTNISQQELAKIFKNAGVKAIRFDDAIYRKAGLDPLPLNLSPAMIEVLKAGLQKTNNLMRNLTLTTALDGQEKFIQVADLIHTQVTSGAFDYQSALKSGIKQVANEGLTVIHFSGRKDHLDVALRRAVLTGVNQTAGILQTTRADEMGADLVQTSAHAGARNTGTGPANHEGWQGKVFSRSGASEKYPNFVERTGYGTGAGLCGWNCRHSFYPYFEGLSPESYSVSMADDLAQKTVNYRDKQIDMYQATQIQRGIERKIRQWKRQASAMEAGGINNEPELEAIRYYQAQMREFIKQTGLQRQRFREQIYE